MESGDVAAHLESKNGTPIKGLNIACVVLTGIVLILRCWSRATSPKTKFGADDWTALASWPIVAAFNLLTVKYTTIGFGLHVVEVPPEDLVKGLKISYASYHLYDFGMTLIRVSAIPFYIRIFDPRNSRYRYFIWATLGFNLAWLLSFEIVTTVPCLPIHSFWDLDRVKPSSSPPKCLSIITVHIWYGITSVLLDLMVLVLPVHRLVALQISLLKKIRVIFIFIMGYCVIIFTIGRLVSIIRAGKQLNTDFTCLSQPHLAKCMQDTRLIFSGALVTPLYWFTCEISMASVCISLPMIPQLVQRATQQGFLALFDARKYPDTSLASRPIKNASAEDGFARLNDREVRTTEQILLGNMEPYEHAISIYVADNEPEPNMAD
ncbi:uncharacterized protein KY384_005627 [Bacidia gigantensis]|uniref:uncharacterized protein n=1 Tax=Bacidia gigantensis TaxID=2732470 RepID=UPI001D036723|nr:uncharacterized protein KY384_005627 [Bacidia gigantensis]KAG8530144.1 hypothetical protein KY384_005627 [Bacidia gigantensis]